MYLVILPRASHHDVAPGPLTLAALWIVIAGSLAFLPATPVPKWGRCAHRARSFVVWLLFAAVVLSPWVSAYRIVISFHTAALYLGVRVLPRLRTAWRRPFAARAAGRSATVTAVRSGIVALGVVVVFAIMVRTQLAGIYGGN